ncbi:MAG: MFS transporter [Deltaproteobacteria bacterium]|nr:MFS transporter [Deltaproteobacteria bacterium]
MERGETDFKTGKVLIISGSHFVHDVFSSFIAPFLPLLIGKFGLSMVLAGSLTVFFRLPSLANPVVGMIADRVNLRYLVIAAPAFTAAAMSLLGNARNYKVLCVLLLLGGASASVLHVLGPILIARSSGGSLGKGMSFWMTGGEMARTVGPLVAVWAVSALGFEGCYPLMSVGILGSFLLYLSLKETSTKSAQSSLGGFSEAWRSLRPVLIPLTGITLSRAFLVASLTAFLPTFMVGLGKSLWLGGASLSVLELSGILGTLFGGTLSDRVGRRAVLFFSLPTSSLLMLLFIYGEDWIRFPVLLLLGGVVFTFIPVNLAIVHDHCGEHRGTATGIYMTIHFLTIALVTVLVGWLADLFSLRFAFTLSALMGLAGFPAVFFIPRHKEIPTRIGGDTEA